MHQAETRDRRDSGTAKAAGRPHRALASIATFSLYALHRFNRDGCFAASGALSYTTLVSLVPLGVIGLGVLSAFPNLADSREELLQLIFRNFVPGISEQAAWWFQHFAGSAAQATAIGIVGTAAVGVLLLVTVEDQLNALWRTTVPRPWVQRVLAYWTLITMGPLLVGTSLTLSTYLNTAARRAGLDPEAIAQFASGWPHVLARAIPFLLEWLACTLLYIVIPNCTVRWRDAALGAAVASISVEVLKIGFVIYIASLSSYQVVYGAIATIPIFLLWMYLSWMAVLLGAVVAANLPTWKVDERFNHLTSGGIRLGFSLSLIAALDRAQRRGVMLSIADLAGELGVPTSVLDEHLKVLARGGFTAATQGGRWVLAWNPETATLHDLYVALGLPLAGTWLPRPSAPWQLQVAPAMERIIRAESVAMRITLAALLADIRAPEALMPDARTPTGPASPRQVRIDPPRRVAERGGAE
jgi:membrane protein